MAIIQISKIQQRSGNLVDLPQLDEAQFGWATDAKRLFIGKTTPNENIEVLTSYSNISFSQVTGSDGGNFNVSGAVNGQLLAYVSSTDTWENWTGDSSQLANSKLQLGSASNISISGGATGYILETDGAGNLSWTSKGTLRTNIVGISNATPIVMTVPNTTPYTNGLAITISGANATNANSIVNGLQFYVKLSNNFPTSGNVSLYTTSDLSPANAAVGTNLGTYTANSGVATALITGGGTSTAGGSDTTIQYNVGGVLSGSANFTITGGNLVTLNGNFVAGNVNAGNALTANFVTGTLRTSAQPNITSTGTLVSLSVSGNANIGNIGTAGLITATGNVRGGNLVTPGVLSVTGNANVGNLGTAGVFATTLSATGNANVGNLGATSIVGTITTASQTNITAVGTLASLSVSGNANIGNVGATLFVGNLSGTGNSNVGNLGATLVVANISGTGNSNIGNLGVSGLITVTGNVTGGNLVTSGVVSASGNATVLGIKTDNYYYANGAAISFAGTYSNSNVASYLPTYTGQVGTTGATIYGNTLTTGANTTTGTITGNWSLSSGSRLNATYADLAEYYEADQHYEPGTVLEFGGEKEVTIAEDGTTRVAGVVSTNPAYAMNAKCPGIAVPVALQGRVPCKVRGHVHKGDMMVSAGNGFARPWNNPQMGMVIGKALENFEGVEGVIEIAVGRL